MRFQNTLPVVLLSAISVHAAPAPAPATAGTSSACGPVHIIVARASTEAAGVGMMGSLATLVQKQVPGTTIDAVDYPAEMLTYSTSSAEGTAALTAQLTDYVGRCPTSKVVLMGYSQGAQVVGDTLCGGGGGFMLGKATPPVATAISDHVVAMIQMGDPRHLPNKSYNVGTGTGESLFPRDDKTQSCQPFANKIKSYCDSGDPFCDGGMNLAAHLSYTWWYNNEARDFVLSKVQ